VFVKNVDLDDDDSSMNLYLEKQQNSITRGHTLVNNIYHHYDSRKFSFAPIAGTNPYS